MDAQHSEPTKTPIAAGISTDSEPLYVHKTQSAIFVEPSFGPHACNVKCTYCGTQVITVERSAAGLFTWIFAIFLCFVGFPFCLCIIPFCMRDCADIEHVCPVCRNTIGVYKRM